MLKDKLYKIRCAVSFIVLILCILGMLGVCYPVKIFDIQLAALLQRVFIDFSVIALFLLISIFVLTLLFGRIYCSILCPFGIIQECTEITFRKKNEYQRNLPFKYFIAAVVFGGLTAGSVVFIKYFEPYTFFGSAFTLSAVGIIAIITIILIVFFKNRFFCTNLCPVGTILGLVSKLSINKIYIKKESCVSCGICEKNCPSGCINSKEKIVNNETCIKCLKCLEICPKDSLNFGMEPISFSPNRRDFLIGASAFVVFGIFTKIGLDLKEKISAKISDVILPPGAVSEERFINKCLNCNLCVTNCPQKIIKKADENFGAVHIDYSNGYCDFECNICSQICPAGAIKKLSLKEKKNTRIASAMIKKSDCADCGQCIGICPKNAISIFDKKPVINVEKCIGCGICKTKCLSAEIEMYAVKEQKLLST